MPRQGRGDRDKVTAKDRQDEQGANQEQAIDHIQEEYVTKVELLNMMEKNKREQDGTSNNLISIFIPSNLKN